MKKSLILFACIFVLFTEVRAGDFLYYFEDNNDPAMLTNANDGQYSVKYVGDTHQTTTEAKFGKGSMVIDEKKGPSGNLISGFTTMPSEFIEEIQKMTITFWIKSATTGDFFIVERLPGGTPGYFALNYSISYKCLFFSFVGTNGARLGARSTKIPFMEPGEWMHVAMTFDEGKVVFYVNGVTMGDGETASQGVTSIPAAQGAVTLVGFSRLAPGSYVDDFGFFTNKVLSESDIDVVFNKGLESFVKSSSPKAIPKPAPTTPSPIVTPSTKK
ncbi:MAG: LamG-like jellyroll fold domain-containing protein [Chthoniobacterales bacterium]